MAKEAMPSQRAKSSDMSMKFRHQYIEPERLMPINHKTLAAPMAAVLLKP